MFANSIEIAKGYTRCMKSIMRGYGSNEITRCCSTFIIVNDEGWVLTCKHIVEGLLIPADTINPQYMNFKQERSQISALPNGKQKKAIEVLEIKYGYSKSAAPTVQLLNMILHDIDMSKGYRCYIHPSYDLALIKFEGLNHTQCNNFPIFMDDTSHLRQGLSLCRLGFPFAEFTDYQYNAQTDNLEWIGGGIATSPCFPVDGILTRFVNDEKGVKFGIELSTPGLIGQSGGPLFDRNGVVCGLQFETVSIPLGFDQVNQEIVVNRKKKKVSNYPFMHLGRCIHVDIIKQFMNENNVKYQVG